MAKPLRDLHDVELAALAAAGDRPAFGELVRRHGSAVRGLLRRMGLAMNRPARLLPPGPRRLRTHGVDLSSPEKRSTSRRRYART